MDYDKMNLLCNVIVIGKDAEVQQLAQQVSQKIFVADDLVEAFDIVETVRPDLIIVDSKFDTRHIQKFIRTTYNNFENIPVVVVDGDEKNPDKFSQFEQIGIYAYLPSKQNSDLLKQIAHRIKNKCKIDTVGKNISNFFVDECAESLGVVGRSKSFIKTFKMIKLVAASECNPVLIIGETGTGKELAAKAIHELRHPNERFVAVNCAALTANLLESELFGHVKGSFTGADRDKTGLLEWAGAGTIFLDEISEMPLDLQAKLLRVLQERTFRKVGGIKNIACRATIIASSNRNLHKETKINRFRGDLYYRLNICPVNIAALRSPDRRDDIPLLADYFVKISTICPEKSRKITSLTKFAIEALLKHDWPGNVRELHNVIDRAILFETTDKIGLSNIILNPAECDMTELGVFEHASEEFPDETEQATPLQASASGRKPINDFSLAKAERELVARALAETGWRKTQAAALLGITRTTLYAKVKQYNIKRNSKDHFDGKVADGLPNNIIGAFEPQSLLVT
jgi:DNA-binding NtrC family response regulator